MKIEAIKKKLEGDFNEAIEIVSDRTVGGTHVIDFKTPTTKGTCRHNGEKYDYVTIDGTTGDISDAPKKVTPAKSVAKDIIPVVPLEAPDGEGVKSAMDVVEEKAEAPTEAKIVEGSLDGEQVSSDSEEENNLIVMTESGERVLSPTKKPISGYNNGMISMMVKKVFKDYPNSKILNTNIDEKYRTPQ